ncbi:hypothetical protein BGX29_006572 [Mortierella sp. GBA35]|nr:hypothetical protein BGX29_006572 [Mortierella sp. GBA35]
MDQHNIVRLELLENEEEEEGESIPSQLAPSPSHGVIVPVNYQMDAIDDEIESEDGGVGQGEGGGEEAFGYLERSDHQNRNDIEEEGEQEGGGPEVVDIQKKEPDEECILDYPTEPSLEYIDPSSHDLLEQQPYDIDIDIDNLQSLPQRDRDSLSTLSMMVLADMDGLDTDLAHDHGQGQDQDKDQQQRSRRNLGKSVARDFDPYREINPIHPLDLPQQPHQEQQHGTSIDDGNSDDSLSQQISTPPPTPQPQLQQQQQQQQQSDRIRWRLSTNYPPSRRTPERNSVFLASPSNNACSVYGYGFGGNITTTTTADDAISIRSSATPTTFVMVDTDGNQILTDPYTSSLTPPLPSPLSAITAGFSSGGGGSGKAVPLSSPLVFTVPRIHFGTTINTSINTNTSTNTSSTADPQVAAHIAEALRMYGIPSLHPLTTVHPFQRFSMSPSSTGSGFSVPGVIQTGGSTSSLRVNRSGSGSSSSGPSRVVRVWAALTGRDISTMTTTNTRTTSTTTETSTRSRFRLPRPQSSMFQYEELPFVQQPQLPTVVFPAAVARTSMTSVRPSSASSSFVAGTGGDNGGGGNNGGQGDRLTMMTAHEEEQEQEQEEEERNNGDKDSEEPSMVNKFLRGLGCCGGRR